MSVLPSYRNQPIDLQFITAISLRNKSILNHKTAEFGLAPSKRSASQNYISKSNLFFNFYNIEKIHLKCTWYTNGMQFGGLGVWQDMRSHLNQVKHLWKLRPADIQIGFLTILTWKNLGFTEFSTTIHWNKRLAAFDVFHMFTQSIKFF